VVTRIVLPAYPGEDLDFAFRTYHGYLEAARRSIAASCPSSGAFLEGVAAHVKGGRWTTLVPRGSALPPRSAQLLRNAWGTEVLLNAPRVIGGADLISFANHWAVVQAYYAVFDGLNALLVVGHPNPPRTHTTLLRWAATEVGNARSPFVAPWTWRTSGPVNAYSYDGFPSGFVPDTRASTIATVSDASAPHILAKALKTTRDRKVEEKKPSWLKGKRTKAGAPRKNLTAAELRAHSAALEPTTLFDLLYRLRIRSNYDDADALLQGALSSADAAAFHTALCDIVRATLLTIEIYLAHRVGVRELERALHPLTIPASLAPHSATARQGLW
jgi:hypothetical protein